MKRAICLLMLLALPGLAVSNCDAAGEGGSPPIPPAAMNVFMSSLEVPPGAGAEALVFLSNLTPDPLDLELRGMLQHRRVVLEEFPGVMVHLNPNEVVLTPFPFLIPEDAGFGRYSVHFAARFPEGAPVAHDGARFLVRFPSPIEIRLHLSTQIVPPGGEMTATLSLRNLTDDPLEFAVWGAVRHKGHQPLRIPIGPRPVGLAPGEEKVEEIVARIPQRAPLGKYELRILAGPRPHEIPWTGARVIFAVAPPPPPE